MPRRHHREPTPETGLDEERLRFGSVTHTADGFVLRQLSGSGSTKTYRCPGCDHEILPGVPHVVAWPADAVEDRRHWHTACWNARGRRLPTGRPRR